ncbi:glycine betaine/L-proline ABC transporter substrate-binding protein ProX [Mesorhizobium sp. M1340]|uniref:glycine betaine/L-proline ABC transporter substrate-binding protein ProX n=1 Tax=Mesorhizobium sp. M1340 TaxID=2957087 RepID=UPI003338BD0C
MDASAFMDPFTSIHLPLADMANDFMRWFTSNFRGVFQVAKVPVAWGLDLTEHGLRRAPQTLVILTLALFAWQFVSLRVAATTICAMMAVGFLGVWDEAMTTLAVVITAVLLATIVGLPLGILCSRSERLWKVVRPSLDFMQTIPSFTYLVPVILLFGVGNVPGVIVTALYGMPPLVRLTNLGLRELDPQLVEAANAFGVSPMMRLWSIDLPLARSTIMAGVNQTVMASLGMSVVASMISVAGLGRVVLLGISQLELGRAIVGGLSIVLMAITVDRVTQGFGFTRRDRGNKDLWERGPIGWLRRVRVIAEKYSNKGGIPMRSILLLATAILMSAAPVAQAETVRPMGTGDIGAQIIYDIIETGLAELGYENGEMLTGTYPTIHMAVAQGDADYSAVFWRPLTDQFFKQAGGDEKMLAAGPLYTGAMQGYFIDKKTADAHGITSLDQMKDPGIAALFDTDGDGKANLVGCNPGWGCEAVIEHQMDAYGLRDHINVEKGEYFALMANAMENYKRGKPIFYTTWAPEWTMSVLVPGKDVVFLNVPFSSLPGVENANTKWEDGRDPGFAYNDNYILVNKEFAKANPKAWTFLDGLRMPIEDLDEAMYRVYRGEDSAEKIEAMAKEWIAKHRAEWDALIAKAKSAT